MGWEECIENTDTKRYLKTSYAAVTENITPSRTQIVRGSTQQKNKTIKISLPRVWDQQ